MARRRYRRYRRKSSRWAPAIRNLLGTNLTASMGTWSSTATLCTNPVQSIDTVSQVYTVKNIEVTFTLEEVTSGGITNVEAVTAYIMYVPQGMNVGSDYHIQHPEYIMAYRYLGSPQADTQTFAPLKVKTRLARKLQTGDSVVLYVNGINNSQTGNYSLALSGIIRWWTKAN